MLKHATVANTSTHPAERKTAALAGIEGSEFHQLP
jgi:hypothetical protein